jgi:membrane-associated phospholipid phosphatase
MNFITDFADQAVVLPLIIAVGSVLWLQGWSRAAGLWALVMIATLGTMLVLKLVFLGCPGVFGATDVRTPSGHVAGATVVAGGLATLLLARRRLVLPLAVLIAFVIGLSRLALGLHTLPETIVGAFVGLAGVAALLRFVGPPPPSFAPRRIALTALAVVLSLHGLHLPAEARIRATAFRFEQYLSLCQSDAGRL